MLYVDQAGARVSSGARENHERGWQTRVVHLLAADHVIFEDRLDGREKRLWGSARNKDWSPQSRDYGTRDSTSLCIRDQNTVRDG
jgi:hypothetical protein